MSDSGNSTCGSECDSGCGSDFDALPIPFTLKVTEKEPLEFKEEGLGMRIDTLTLLEGEDCVVYQEDPEYGRICLGRLFHPYTLNLAVQMEDYMPEMKIVCESKTACVVAVTGCLQEEDEGSMSGDDEEDMEDTATSGVDIEEVDEESAPTLVSESAPAAEDEEMASSDEEEIDAGDTSEDNEEEEAVVEPKKSPQEKKKEVAVQKQPVKKEAPAAKKPVAKPTPAAKPAAEEPKTSPEPAKAKASPAAKADGEEAKTGIRKQLGRGLAYEVLEVGKGPLAVSGKQATVKYVLTLARTGQKMDAGVLKFRVGGGEVVQGFDKGVKGMCVGEKRRISVPSELGYGKKKTGKIPPGSDLIFEVTLQSVKQ